MTSSSFLLFDIVNEVMESPPMKQQMFDVPPLSFDRVNQGHYTSSNFPLFKLPVELFPLVTKYLSRQDFNSLALVDRDCRRLAALNRFKELHVNFASDVTCGVERLLSSKECSFNGSCVRRLKVCIESPAPTKHHRLLPNQLILPAEDTIEERYHDPQVIYDAVSTLPNVYTLEWDGVAFYSEFMFKALQNSSIKNLRLKGVVLDPHNSLSALSPSLSLQSLSLQVSCVAGAETHQPIHFFNNVLNLAGPTLRQLTWKGQLNEDPIFLDYETLTFRELRDLTLDTALSDSHQLLQLFIGPNTQICSLSMDSCTPSTRDFFCSRGNIPTLRHFSWINHITTHASYSDIHIFLSANPQLETLHLSHPVPQTIIDELLLPLLTSEFHSLTSLHLVSDASTIPEATLQTIGSLTTLRQLWLSAGNQGFRSTWEINHQVIRDALRPLPNLKYLAFSHDTYITDTHPLAPRFCDYYTAKSLPFDLDISKYLTANQLFIYRGMNSSYDLAVSQQIQMRRLAWENWHADRMSMIAHEYSRALPSLESCFIGQLPFFKVVDVNSAKALMSSGTYSPRREPCLFSAKQKMHLGLWRPI